MLFVLGFVPILVGPAADGHKAGGTLAPNQAVHLGQLAGALIDQQFGAVDHRQAAVGVGGDDEHVVVLSAVVGDCEVAEHLPHRCRGGNDCTRIIERNHSVSLHRRYQKKPAA